jgi:O-antigen ligase
MNGWRRVPLVAALTILAVAATAVVVVAAWLAYIGATALFFVFHPSPCRGACNPGGLATILFAGVLALALAISVSTVAGALAFAFYRLLRHTRAAWNRQTRAPI